jgi:phosphoribosylglycinamide formyltransferase 1
MFKVGFIVSGKGDNIVLRHLINHADNLGISLHVFSYENDATGVAMGKEHQISFTVVEKGTTNQQLSENLYREVHKFQPNIVFLLFNKLLTAEFLDRAKFPIVNIHPSILPAFTGFKAIDKAIAYGSKITGITAHLVDSSIDQGPTIIQSVIPIADKDNSYLDLKTTITRHYILIATQVLCWFKDNKVEVLDRRIKIKDATYNVSFFYPNIDKQVESICLK